MSSVLGSVEGGVVGGAAAIATAAGIEPIVEPGRQDVWRHNPYRVLEADVLARLVAQGIVEFDPAAEQAQRSGFDRNKFAALVQIELAGPPVAEALNLRRRERISAEQFEHALTKAQIEPQFWPALKELVDERLDPAVIALAIVRGIMRDPGFLPVGPPAAEGKVAAFPTSGIDALDEAASSGINRERLFVETAIAGRPMGPESAASAVFRNIIERVDYDRAIAEGDVRNEWAEAIFQTARQIASVADYVQAHLRGWIDEGEMIAGAARHGMSAADVRLIFLRSGRPAAPVQMFTAWARGVDGPDGQPMNKAQFVKGIRESDIRPEWAEMLWGIRHAYPSLFQLRRAVQDGGISKQRALTILRFERYEDADALALVNSWLAPTTAGAKGLTAAELTAEYEGHYLTHAEYVADLQDLGYSAGQAAEKARVVDAKRVKKARDAVVARARSEYVRHRINRDEARAALVEEAVPEPAQDLLLTEWDHERELTADALTAAQIRKAYRSNIIDRATAIDRLQRVGYDPGDDAIYLDA